MQVHYARGYYNWTDRTYDVHTYIVFIRFIYY